MTRGRSRRVPWRPGRWTLRGRLLASVLLLLAVTSAAIGLVSVLALQQFLVDRLDGQLTAATERTRLAVARRAAAPETAQPPLPGLRPPEGATAFLAVAGQAEDTVGALVQDGVVVRAAVLDRRGAPQDLTAQQSRTLLEVPVGARPRTVDLGEGLGAYRLAAFRTNNDDVIVTGLSLADVDSAVSRLALVLTVVGGAGLVSAGAVGAVTTRLALRPLQRIVDTASQVTAMQLDKGEVALQVRVPEMDARTELGQVGAALNGMLVHVGDALAARHASENRVRQFVADASHELRTPLASIRGYAELTRRTPQHDELPADVQHAMRRVESEATRMSGLVEDLLLLARLDTDPTLDRQPVDLSQLLVETASDAHVTGPQHTWRLLLPELPVVVEGERSRLHQVVANLLTNARVHTPAGTVVTTSLSAVVPAAGAGQAVLTVTDDGPGIPAELVPRVFDRFVRGDSSRSRSAGSTGLGLAIVGAVVAAHGGTVGLETRPGRTCFRIALPLA